MDDELIDLAASCLPALAEYPIDPACPAPGDPGTLHVTLEMIADRPTREIPAAEQEALADALRKELADVRPFVTELGPPMANKAGALLDVWPEAEAVALQERVRAAIRTTRGPEALQHSGGRLHASLGYSWTDADSDKLNSALRGITPRRAELHVDQADQADLLNVRYDLLDSGGWRMSWTPIAQIPLAG